MKQEETGGKQFIRTTQRITNMPTLLSTYHILLFSTTSNPRIGSLLMVCSVVGLEEEEDAIPSHGSTWGWCNDRVWRRTLHIRAKRIQTGLCIGWKRRDITVTLRFAAAGSDFPGFLWWKVSILMFDEVRTLVCEHERERPKVIGACAHYAQTEVIWSA